MKTWRQSQWSRRQLMLVTMALTSVRLMGDVVWRGRNLRTRDRILRAMVEAALREGR